MKKKLAQYSNMEFIFRRNVHSIVFVGMLFLLLFQQKSIANWVKTSGSFGGPIRTLCVNGANVFAASEGGGVFVSVNNGVTWTSINSGLIDTFCTSLIVSDSNLFAGTYRGVFRSAINNISWTLADSGIEKTHVSCLVEIPKSAGASILMAGTYNGIFVSNNNGANWKTANVGMITNYVNVFSVQGINIFAGSERGIYLSTNFGDTWVAVNNGLGDYTSIRSFAVNGPYIFAGTSGYGIYRSENNGASWIPVDSGLVRHNIWSFIVNGVNLFAGTNANGVFLTTNDGQYWTEVDSGLGSTDILSLVVSGSNIVAGTYSDGVWIRPLSEMLTSVRSSKKILSNPKDLAAYIDNNNILRYNLQTASFISIKIYDVGGRVVLTLLNQKQEMGGYTLKIPSGLSKGRYILSLKAGEFKFDRVFLAL